MAGILVCGAQWGDEGKGRFVDLLAGNADLVIRYQGGNNAGHTVIVGGETYKLHLIPSGILYKDIPCIIGNGMVVNPKAVLEEIQGLNERGVDTSQLLISDRAHLVLPYHAYLDKIYEDNLGDKKIGTTKKGIGPAYTDKTTRVGIRACDLLDLDRFAMLVRKQVAEKNNIITKVYGKEPMDADEIIKEYSEYAKKLAPYITDTSLVIYEAQKQGKKLLFEGAQGMLLDLDFGTYPFVTSSHPTAGGVFSGAGIGPRALDEIMGVVKAYTTRVGAGPFVTELDNKIGEEIRQKGFEFGTTTGRPRRCGWLDLVIIEFAARLNGITSIALSKVDTLGGFDKLSVCIGYELDGKVIRNYPALLSDLERCNPVYKEFDGWGNEVCDIREYDKLPKQLKDYIEFIEEFLNIPVDIIGVGPKRDECIIRKEF